MPLADAATLTRDKDVRRYGASTAGYFTASQDFQSGTETWGSGILTFAEFTWAGSLWGSLGFGVDAGATMEIQQVAGDRIDLLVVNPTLAGVHIYVSTPGKAAPGSVLGTTSWSKAGDVVTIEAGPGWVPLTLLYGGGGGGGGGGYVPPVNPPFIIPGIPGNPALPAVVADYRLQASAALVLLLFLTREDKAAARKRRYAELVKKGKRQRGFKKLREDEY
jgi:hypothetical protein